MSVRKMCGWAVLIALGCNGKLSIAPESGGGAGVAGQEDRAVGGGGDDAGGNTAHDGTAGKPAAPGPSEGGQRGDSGGFGGMSLIGGGQGPVAGSGGTVIPRGDTGQDCIPGGEEAEPVGSPAKANVKWMAYCNEGLACNAQGKCVVAPDCPQPGLCVLRRAEVGGSGGSGGSGGVPGVLDGPPSGGPSKWPSYAGFGAVLPSITTEQVGVVSLTANESHAYWLEYGTRNALGSYQHDGRLWSYRFENGDTKLIASGLEGPMGVKLTTTHAYVYVDGGRLVGTSTRPQLFRVPLTGGNAELVQDGTQDLGLVAVGDTAYWSKGNQFYSQTSNADATPNPYFVADGYRSGLTSDGSDLYYATMAEGLKRTSIASAVETQLGLGADDFVLHDDGIYTINYFGDGGLLARAPKSGGDFEPIGALGAGSPSGLKAVGDRYFFGMIRRTIRGNAGHYMLVQYLLSAGFAGADPPIRLIQRPYRQTVVDNLWVGTATDLYWSDGGAIYKQPLPTP